MDKEEKKEWTQFKIIHCPYKNCKGMLLQHREKHEHLCSDCDTLFMEVSTGWEIVEENYLSNN